MCLNYFDHYESLPHEQKINILNLYFNTNRKDGEDIVVDRIVTHYGCYIDLDSIKLFFKNKVDNCEDHIRFVEPLLKIAFQNVKKMMRLRINEQEMAAIVAILFWNTVEKFGLLSDQMDEKRKALIVDLNNMEVKILDFKKALLERRLFYLPVARIEMKDTLDVGKIFLPFFRDVWDDETCPVPTSSCQNNSTETMKSDVYSQLD
uniref:NR LBD domain-containing protein n=1 Tax=Ditylenchus dipsaci TaxID=166011 RepID=A0A915E3F3_9BILA